MRIVKLPKNFLPKEEKKLSLQETLEHQARIVVVRKYGGYGDILCSRPLFKTIKHLYPDLHVTYAAPKEFHDVLVDHPYIDQVIDIQGLDLSNYGYAVDISRDCGRYEHTTAPFVDKHRSDIWAEISLGIKLVDHDFCLHLDPETKAEAGRRLIEDYGYTASPKICLVTKSASPSKDIEDAKVVELVEMMHCDGLFPVIVATPKQKFVYRPDCKIINDVSLKDLSYLFSNFDYIVSVDTGAFHLANALNIPTVGIFTWTDSKILSMYHKKAILIQRHRDDDLDFAECPCWSWSGCKYRESGRPTIPLKCMVAISATEILNTLKALMEKFPKCV